MRTHSLRAAVLTLTLAASPVSAAPDPDLDCEPPVRTPDIALCAQRRLEAADARLKRAYLDALAAIDRTDVPADARVKWRRALVTAQRRWLAFQASECAAVGYSWYGGTGRSGAELDCRTELSDARTKQLRQHAGLK